ncbi:hypothetical protein HanHA300_Chr01g0016491 [Helianthus annuus]|nr:hypothetical protein HanHA300_Chr01g0016491 [Helianthus annuus]
MMIIILILTHQDKYIFFNILDKKIIHFDPLPNSPVATSSDISFYYLKNLCSRFYDHEINDHHYETTYHHDFRFSGLELYFWLSLIPFFLLLAVGTKLEHIIIQLAHEVAEKHVAIEGELVVHPSDDHFWFQRPKIVLFFIHFILFQNAFEFAFFFWVWAQYGFDSCIMWKVSYIISRLIIGVFIQVLCSYSTLPLYALVTQMGTHFKKSIFEEHIQAKVVGWAQHAKKKTTHNGATNDSGQDGPIASTSALKGIQIG